MPIIVIELVLVFGGVLLFGWWQLRDLDRERARREQKRAQDPIEREQDPRPPAS